MQRILLIFLIYALSPLLTHAQDSLPKFSVKNRSGKIIIGWNNPFKDVVLINVQRSTDSLTGFKTILGVADPTSVTNGFLDAKAPDTKQFYRLYVQRQGGIYFFTKSSKPILDTFRTTSVTNVSTINTTGSTDTITDKNALGQVSKITSTQQKKQSARNLPASDSIKIEAPPAEKIFTPSVFVYTNPQGHVIMALPTDKSQVYTIKFYREDGTHLFTMNKIKEPYLTIDKTNFIKSGWFNFELYENNMVKEKHKFFIPKER